MAAVALESQGTNFYVWNTVLSPDAWDPICITDFNGPGGSASVIDVTTLCSTRKEKLMGLPDEGQFSINGNYLPDDTGQGFLKTLRAGRTLGSFRVSLSDSPITHITFSGYVLSFQIAAGVDAKLTFSATIEISGEVDWDATSEAGP